MRCVIKTLGIAFISLFILQLNIAHSSTVDYATLSPSSATIQTGHWLAMTFSATNDKAFDIKTYYAKFNYTKGLNITNISTNPAATKAEINTRKNSIILEWSNIGQGITLTADFYVSSSAQGLYSISPSKIYYKDYDRNTYIGFCSSAEITIQSDIESPSPPKNIRSVSGEGFINIYWSTVPDSDVAGYNIYRRTSSSTYSRINPSLIDRYAAGYKDANVQHGMTYYYEITSVDNSGNESVYSSETTETYYDLKIRSFDTPDISAVAVGDINGDGYPDMVFGYPGYCSGRGSKVVCSGKVDIYYGGNTSGNPDISVYGEGFNFGESLAIVDLNNDGYDELIIGAPEYTPPDNTWTYQEIGKIYIYSGAPELNTTAVFSMVGRQSFGDGGNSVYWLAERLGSSLAPAGDVNGDGFSDVLVGAPYGGMDRSGSVVILFGGSNLSNPGTYRFSGPNAWELMGFYLSTAGDVNGDGYSDILTGGPGFSDLNKVSGAYLLYGGQYLNRGLTLYGVGAVVSSAGDMNGDGHSDIAMGRNIYYGGPSLDNVPDIVLSDSFNFTSQMGDINQDGFGDILTGPGPKICFGSSFGENIPDISREGMKVLTAADINKDGLKEIIALDEDIQPAGNKIYIYSVAPYLNLPEITIFSPKNNSITAFKDTTISGYVKGNITKLLVRGQQTSLMPDGTFSATESLFEGDNIIEIIAETPEGKISKRVLTLKYSTQITPLTIAIISPSDGAVLNNTPTTVTGTVSDSTAAVTINGVQATVSGNIFTATGLNLHEGLNVITASASDNYGQIATHSIAVTLVTKAVITGTVTDSVTGLPLSNVTITVTDSFGTHLTTTDSNGGYTVSGLTSGSFTATFVKSGYIQQTFNGSINAGQTLTINVQLTPLSPLTITIINPQDGAVVSSSSITVTGTVTNNVNVTVNGIQASVSNNTFSATISLIEGQNTITAIADDMYGQTASHSITVTLTGLLDSWEISINPLALNFDSMAVGASQSLELTISNIGIGNLVIGTISRPSSPFLISFDECSGKSLSASAACWITVKFAPDAEGTFTSTLTVPSNDADHP
ncbi:MAG: FG-GAP-like repeat-containing protein, partial [Nitrospirota bacterium]|nr:FG-GAP-like repeat-containing protein [Nitrospirota bacterium]